MGGSSRPCGSGATIKEQISTPVVRPLIVVTPKHVLVPHRAHRFIIDVQPGFAAATATALRAAISVRVQHIERIVPAACGHAMMVEHAIERVARRLCESSGSRCHDVLDGYSQPQLPVGERRTYRGEFRALM